MKVAMAISKIIGTNHKAILSTSLEIGALEFDASSTSFTIV